MDNVRKSTYLYPSRRFIVRLVVNLTKGNSTVRSSVDDVGCPRLAVVVRSEADKLWTVKAGERIEEASGRQWMYFNTCLPLPVFEVKWRTAQDGAVD